MTTSSNRWRPDLMSNTKQKEKPKDDVGDFPPKDNTPMLLKPPTTLLAPTPMSEAEKAFLDESQELPSGPTKLPTIQIKHKRGDGEFMMPDGSVVDGHDGLQGFIIAHFTTRSFFSGAYDANNAEPPDCTSADCITPDAGVRDRQSADCATCKQNVFGSAKVGKGKACREFVRLFLVNPEFGNPPVAILTLPPTGISKFYGGQMTIGGKRGYLDQLKARHRAWQIVWSKITTNRVNEDDAHVEVSFEMGDIASIDVAKALAQINNQFVNAIKAARRELPVVDAPAEKKEA